MKPKKLLIEELSRDANTQCRVATDDEAVSDYAAALKSGAKLPPIHVFFDGQNYFIADGWHRVLAHVEAGEDFIDATISRGDQRDAELYAAGANETHGVRRTNKDKRLAVLKLLKDREWSKWSDRKVAEHCKVDHKTVADVRKKQGGEFPTTQQKPRKKQSQPYPPDGDSEEKSEAEEEVSFAPESLDDGVADIEELAAPYKQACRLLNGIKRDFRDLSEDERFGVFLSDKITRITTGLDEVKGTIRQAEPVEHCGKCQGKGCSKCSSAGFITRMAVRKT